MNLQEYVRDVNNFPKEGILFKDITPLLQSPEATSIALNQLLALVGNENIDKVIGIESRGFFFGTLLAHKLNAGFVPVRKKGKLPFHVISQTYDLEYGTDTLQIHQDAINKGDRVLLHDDVLATGGTAKAVTSLIETLGGVVVQCNFLMILDSLKGSEKLKGFPVKSVMHF